MQFYPLRQSGSAWNQLSHCTFPENPASSPTVAAAADSICDIQMTGYSRRQGHYQRHQQQMSAMSDIGVTDCHDVRHVTSTLPVLPRPTAHAWLSDRCQLFVGDYRHLAYQQADMRTDAMAFPVPDPVETPCNHGSQYGDFLRQQVEYSDATMEKLYSLDPTSMTSVCTSFDFLIVASHTYVIFVTF